MIINSCTKAKFYACNSNFDVSKQLCYRVVQQSCSNFNCTYTNEGRVREFPTMIKECKLDYRT